MIAIEGAELRSEHSPLLAEGGSENKKQIFPLTVGDSPQYLAGRFVFQAVVPFKVCPLILCRNESTVSLSDSMYRHESRTFQ